MVKRMLYVYDPNPQIDSNKAYTSNSVSKVACKLS